MQQYQYEPLDSSGRQIRLLVLHPRTSSTIDSIRVTIFKYALAKPDPGFRERYMALSYVWGDANQTKDLLVLDPSSDDDSPSATSNRRLRVTHNLAEALLHMPRPNEHVLFWVDAVCINQQDAAERSQQVRLMAEIYSSASLVLAWLGPAADESDLALNLLTHISTVVNVDRSSLEISRVEPQRRPGGAAAGPGFLMYLDMLVDPNFPIPWDGPEAQAIEKLFFRPWFERLWIRQEVILGGDRAVLQCGRSSIMWDDFRKAAMVIHKKAKDDKHPELYRWWTRARFVADIGVHQQAWLGQLLRQMQMTSCADPRDRIYGILGMIPGYKGVADAVEPNYDSPVHGVYRDFMLAELKVTRRIHLLGECRLASQDSSWKPSWVPNWSVKRERMLDMQQQSADGQSTAKAECIDGNRLRIMGVQCATVTETLPAPESVRADRAETNVAEPLYVAFAKKVVELITLSGDFKPGGATLDALCHVFSGSYLREHVSGVFRNQYTPSAAEFNHFILFLLGYDMTTGKSTVDPTSEDRGCASAMETACVERSFLRTKEGYMGMGPRLTQPGDLVCVFPGCSRPMVIRPQEDKGDNNSFTVVGPCNVYGLNWGEALLGPLPEGYAFVWDNSGPSGDVSPAFKDLETGEESVRDPRLNWDLLETDDDALKFVRRGVPGRDEVKHFKAPDVEYFEKCGVSLKTFDLV